MWFSRDRTILPTWFFSIYTLPWDRPATLCLAAITRDRSPESLAFLSNACPESRGYPCTMGFSGSVKSLVKMTSFFGCVPRSVEKERHPPLRHQSIISGGNLRVFENLAQTLVAVDAS